MNIAYLILTHNTPNHLKHLIRVLATPRSFFFIHVDKKSPLSLFAGIQGDNLMFTKERIPVYWGDYTQVEAILVLLKSALNHSREFDRFVLLSGADYPLRSAEYIENFFREKADVEFINMVSMPCEQAGKPISRLTTYQLRASPRPIETKVRRLFSRIGSRIYKRNYRAFLGDLQPYGGSTWWAISRAAAKYIVAFAESRPVVVQFFKNTVSPDESFFQTILGNSVFKAKLSRGLTYAEWIPGAHSPATFSERHLPRLRATPMMVEDDLYGAGELLFARKFPDESDELVRELTSNAHDTREKTPR